jgi:hypothetical protein
MRRGFASRNTRRDAIFSNARSFKARRRWVLLRRSNDGEEI